MTLQARVALTKRVKAGTEASYGHHWKAAKDTTLALIPLGFADGLPRRSWREASVLINGVRCGIAGPIAMDQFIVDAGDLPVRAGDRVVIFGSGREGEATALDWAGWADTVASAILCGVGARVPRRYVSLGAHDPAPDAGRP